MLLMEKIAGSWWVPLRAINTLILYPSNHPVSLLSEIFKGSLLCLLYCVCVMLFDHMHFSVNVSMIISLSDFSWYVFYSPPGFCTGVVAFGL